MRMKPSKQKGEHKEGVKRCGGEEKGQRGLRARTPFAKRNYSPGPSFPPSEVVVGDSNAIYSLIVAAALSLYLSLFLSLLTLSLLLLPLLLLLLSAFLQFRLIALKWVSLFGPSLFYSVSIPPPPSVCLSLSLSPCHSAKLCLKTKMSHRRQH